MVPKIFKYGVGLSRILFFIDSLSLGSVFNLNHETAAATQAICI